MMADHCSLSTWLSWIAPFVASERLLIASRMNHHLRVSSPFPPACVGYHYRRNRTWRTEVNGEMALKKPYLNHVPLPLFAYPTTGPLGVFATITSSSSPVRHLIIFTCFEGESLEVRIKDFVIATLYLPSFFASVFSWYRFRFFMICQEYFARHFHGYVGFALLSSLSFLSFLERNNWRSRMVTQATASSE